MLRRPDGMTGRQLSRHCRVRERRGEGAVGRLLTVCVLCTIVLGMAWGCGVSGRITDVRGVTVTMKNMRVEPDNHVLMLAGNQVRTVALSSLRGFDLDSTRVRVVDGRLYYGVKVWEKESVAFDEPGTERSTGHYISVMGTLVGKGLGGTSRVLLQDVAKLRMR